MRALTVGDVVPVAAGPGLEAVGSPTLPTTLARLDDGLLKHLKLAEGWRDIIEAAAGAHGIRPCVIAGIGSRESGWGLLLEPPGPAGTGDGGHGRGLMQIDDRSFPEFCAGEEWKDPEPNVGFGCEVLAEKRAYIRKRLILGADDELRATVAAYNCGQGNVLKVLARGEDVDARTTHKDYSRDVLDRAGWFGMHGWA